MKITEEQKQQLDAVCAEAREYCRNNLSDEFGSDVRVMDYDNLNIAITVTRIVTATQIKRLLNLVQIKQSRINEIAATVDYCVEKLLEDSG